MYIHGVQRYSFFPGHCKHSQKAILCILEYIVNLIDNENGISFYIIYIFRGFFAHFSAAMCVCVK